MPGGPVTWTGSLPGHLQYNGLLIGTGTPWRWYDLEGWEEIPGLDTGTVLRPARHGAWPGRLLAQTRIVTAELIVQAQPSAMEATIRQLDAATTIDIDTEVPLIVQLSEEAPLMAWARCIRRSLPPARTYRTGLVFGALMWEATDPRRYGLTEHTTTIPQPASGAGLTYPLTYPLTYGTGTESGSRQLTNTGNVPTSPLLQITGPCTTPAITDTTHNRVIEFDLVLAASETLTVDTAEGTALLGAADRLYALTTRSVPIEAFELPPGMSELAFRAQSFAGGGAVCTVTWRDAWM